MLKGLEFLQNNCSAPVTFPDCGQSCSGVIPHVLSKIKCVSRKLSMTLTAWLCFHHLTVSLLQKTKPYSG